MDEILEILENDAKLTPEEIGKMINKPKDEVAKIISDYEQKGVILGYRAIINKEILGITRQKVVALIEVKVTPEKDVGFDKIAEKIYRFEEVKSCYLVSGDYDLLLIVEGKDIHTVAEFVAEKLSPMENVNATRTHFLLKKYKEDGVYFVQPESVKRMSVSI